jgi:hypothetical protein
MGFKFLTIVKNGNGPETSVYRLVLDSELHEEMERAFTIAAGKWQDAAVQRATFDESYTLADNEIFEIKQFVLPEDMLNAVRFPQDFGEFDVNIHGVANIKAIAAVNLKDDRVSAIFKTVSKARKLEPRKNLTLVSTNKGYAKLTTPGIIIDDRIAAIFVDDTLLFKSPSAVKQIMSLKAYMKEANDLEIIAFLEARFEANTEKVLAAADTWTRKRFSSLMQSKLFDEKSALDIYEAGREFSTEIPLNLSKDRSKLVMPEEKQDIRMILKFLNEEYYKGVLTGKDYQTSAKRPLAKPEGGFGAPRKKGLSFSR